jgi:hypothetical protein
MVEAVPKTVELASFASILHQSTETEVCRRNLGSDLRREIEEGGRIAVAAVGASQGSFRNATAQWQLFLFACRSCWVWED